LDSNSIQAVFFDVGATLLTPAEDEGVIFSHIARQLGAEVQSAEVTRLVPAMYDLYERLYEQDDSFWSDDVRAQAIWLEMYEYLASLLKMPQSLHQQIAEKVYHYYFSPGAWKPFDDVLPCLNALRAAGIRMGLISNWDSSLRPIVEGLGLAPCFETIVASAEVRLHKPMPEIFKLALDRLGLSAGETLHVGDHVHADAEAAAAVGITPILLDRQGRHPEFSGLRVKNLTEIITLAGADYV
jgi:putative hydrolase of the HAD superfamily